jgi:hypothetical protein
MHHERYGSATTSILAPQTVHQWWNSPKAMKFPRVIVDKDATDAAAPAADAEEAGRAALASWGSGGGGGGARRSLVQCWTRPPSRRTSRGEKGGEDTVQAVASARPSSVTSRMKKIGLFYIDTHPKRFSSPGGDDRNTTKPDFLLVDGPVGAGRMRPTLTHASSSPLATSNMQRINATRPRPGDPANAAVRKRPSDGAATN